PIYSIMLARGLTTNVPLYSCTPGASPATTDGDAGTPEAGVDADAGTARDCLVDMADPTALANLFRRPANIPPDTYDSIVVMPCTSSGGFTAKLKGSVDLEGTTYYTTSGSPVISTNPADLGYTSIHYAGCGNTINLPAPLVVHERDSITVSAFFTLTNLSWVLGNFSPGLGGCADAPAHGSSVCSGLPVLVAYIGAAAPTLDSFYISEDPDDLLATKAGGQVMLLSSGGEPFSGFLRRVYSHDSVSPSVSYDVPIRAITRNAETAGSAADAGANATLPDGGLPDGGLLDGGAADAGTLPSYDIRAIGDPAQDVTKYRVRFPRFVLGDHDGTLFTANGASQIDYRAVKR
ncbi:MAG TPA: hypothetical protein VG963_09625, partial [Polyangiaceae bacterium]|nr:hypothetical protein [Polyangiaceae bacterium]